MASDPQGRLPNPVPAIAVHPPAGIGHTPPAPGAATSPENRPRTCGTCAASCAKGYPSSPNTKFTQTLCRPEDFEALDGASNFPMPYAFQLPAVASAPRRGGDVGATWASCGHDHGDPGDHFTIACDKPRWRGACIAAGELKELQHRRRS